MYDRELDEALDWVATRGGGRGFTFDDLARAAARHDARLSDIAEWLARGRTTGRLEELGFDAGAGPVAVGPRRYRLAQAVGETQRAAS